MAAVNPFLDSASPPLTSARGFLLLLLMPFVILRLALIFALVMLYIAFLMAMQKDMDPSDPLRPKFRNYPAVLRATKAMNRACLWLFGFSLQVNGFANAEAAFTRNLCPVVVANHISFLDIWLIGAVIGPYFPVARGDMKDWPVFGRVIALWGFAGVENFGSSPDAAKAAKASRGEGLTARLLARVKAAGPWGLHPPVLVFPEGTCTNGLAVLRFKTGAFVLGSAVLPVAIRYEARQCCGWVYTRPAISGIWRRVPRTLVQLFRIVAEPRKRIVVDILPVHAPSAEELADPALFAANVRGKMAAKLGLPDCDLAMEDARRFYAACEASGKPPGDGEEAGSTGGAQKRSNRQEERDDGEAAAGGRRRGGGGLEGDASAPAGEESYDKKRS